jgi:hypothetical protein
LRDKIRAAETAKKYYKDHKDEIKAKKKAYREAHPEVTALYREINREKINAHSRAAYHANIEKEHARRKAYYEAHKEEARNYERLKRESVDWRKKKNKHQQKYRLAHPDKTRAMCKEWHDRNKDKDRLWCANNKDKKVLHCHNRRARKLNATIEKFSLLEIYERDKWRCQICGKKVDRRLKHPNPLSKSLDHIIPLAKGGSHSRANVQLAHLVCNLSIGVGGIKQTRLF